MQTAIIKHLVPTKSSELIADCRKLASERLPTSLGVALNQVDDALFDLANTADNSLRQNLYFDAMRELRIKRAEFENSFIQSFDTNFENSLDLTKAHREEQGLNVDTELALVETDEVEQTLAVINFADSMKSRCRDELFALDKRIGLLLRKPELDDVDNPLGPQAIGDALREACEHLDADIEVKLTLFKLFDKFASVLIHELYRDINQYLVRSDVLPTITTPTPRQGRTRKTRVIIESEQDSVDDAGEDVFSTLQQMMQAQPCGGGGRGVAVGVAGGVGRAPTGGAQSASAATAVAGGASVISAIVDALTVLQRADSAKPSEPIWNAVDQGQIAAGNVNVLRGLRESGVVSDLGPSESLTIDIVSLLFDYILDDPAIPDALKALIGRLQIPVLKVAMLDKDVFSKKTHAARRLLDAFAGA